jgi:hypothetical protein
MIISRETAVLMCELNPSYDRDSLETRIARVDAMVRFQNRTRAQRRAQYLPNPFNNLDLAHLDAGIDAANIGLD